MNVHGLMGNAGDYSTIAEKNVMVKPIMHFTFHLLPVMC